MLYMWNDTTVITWLSVVIFHHIIKSTVALNVIVPHSPLPLPIFYSFFLQWEWLWTPLDPNWPIKWVQSECSIWAANGQWMFLKASASDSRLSDLCQGQVISVSAHCTPLLYPCSHSWQVMQAGDHGPWLSVCFMCVCLPMYSICCTRL